MYSLVLHNVLPRLDLKYLNSLKRGVNITLVDRVLYAVDLYCLKYIVVIDQRLSHRKVHLSVRSSGTTVQSDQTVQTGSLIKQYTQAV